MSDYQRVILVTGSNCGIGLELVRSLAAKGHIVYLSSRNLSAGKEARNKLRDEYGLDVKYIQLDVTDIKSIEAARDEIERSESRVDVLINNAGISEIGKDQNATSNKSIPNIRNVFEVNFFGLIETTTTFLPLLRKGRAGYGVILNVTSHMASNSLQAGPNARPHWTAYNTSKAAVNSYTIALAAELKKEGIKVNCFSPGHTVTKLNHFHPGGKTPEQAAELMIPWVLLGPEDQEKTGMFQVDTGVMAW